MDIMNQRLVKGADIFLEILAEIERSNKDIQVASAWFTDDVLFEAILNKQKEGVKVSVITADIEHNDKLDFVALTNLGGSVLKTKSVGYGMMHEKFCIIDSKVGIHGSYNWTINARKNNKESVIITDHEETVNDLIKYFNEMENKMNTKNSKTMKRVHKMKIPLLGIFGKGEEKKVEISDDPTVNINDSLSEIDNVDKQFESIINSAIASPNRAEIQRLGEENAQLVNGDEGVLGKSMDSLYQLYIAENQQVEDKKGVLKNKVDSKRVSLIANNQVDKTNAVHLEEKIYAENKDLKEQSLSDAVTRKKAKELSVDNIEKVIIPGIEKEISLKNEIIAKLQSVFIKPKIKYYEIAPLLFVFLGLAAALLLFYSSAAYIMLYGKADAIQMVKLGIKPIAQVFNSEALILANQKQGTALFYVLAFVFIPLAIAFTTHRASKVWKVLGVITIILLDIFVAYRVTSVVNQVVFLSSGVQNNEAFYSEANFWIVFLLSAMPFIFFMKIIESISEFFEARHPEAANEKMNFEVDIENMKILDLKQQIKKELETLNAIKEEILRLESQIEFLTNALSELEIEYAKELKNVEQKYNQIERHIIQISELFKNSIDNDNIQISYSALKDRVNIFLKGWNAWLHDQLSVAKAKERSENARKIADIWLAENIKRKDDLKLNAA